MLELYSDERSRLTIADAARDARLSRAAARRVLLTLTQGGYLATDGKFFWTTPRVLRLAKGYAGARSLEARLQPLLDLISRTTGESSSAAILEGEDIVYVARAATRRIMSIGLGVGSRLPSYATSMGRILLAYAPDATQQAFFRRAPYRALTHRTITRAEAMRQELAFIRAHGYALVDEELELGLRSIAVPVPGSNGDIDAAINISVSAAHMSAADMVRVLLPTLRDCVSQLG